MSSEQAETEEEHSVTIEETNRDFIEEFELEDYQYSSDEDPDAVDSIINPEISEDTQPEEDTQASNPANPLQDYSKLTIPILKSILRGKKLRLKGNKADLIARLEASDRGEFVSTELSRQWKDASQLSLRRTNRSFNYTPGPTETILNKKTPLEIFTFFFDDSTINAIAEETNKLNIFHEV